MKIMSTTIEKIRGLNSLCLEQKGMWHTWEKEETKKNNTLRGIIRAINAFSGVCEELEYTDTEQAWDLLNGIKGSLKDLVLKED